MPNQAPTASNLSTVLGQTGLEEGGGGGGHETGKSMNFSKRFRAGKKATTGFPLETALSLLLSIRPASRLFVCVCWAGRERLAKMARKKADDAASCFRASQATSQSLPCVQHHTQYHHCHPHLHPQACHVALFLKLYRASGWHRGGGCAFALRFVAPCIIIDQASRSSLCPLWSCPLARHGHPHSRHLCGLAYAEREEGLNLMA